MTAAQEDLAQAHGVPDIPVPLLQQQPDIPVPSLLSMDLTGYACPKEDNVTTSVQHIDSIHDVRDSRADNKLILDRHIDLVSFELGERGGENGQVFDEAHQYGLVYVVAQHREHHQRRQGHECNQDQD